MCIIIFVERVSCATVRKLSKEMEDHPLKYHLLIVTGQGHLMIIDRITCYIDNYNQSLL